MVVTLQQQSRRLSERTKELDSRYVPLLAAVTRAWAQRLGSAGQQLRRPRQALAQTSPAELDERFASRGLLKTVRDVPQIGFVLVAAVFLAGTATALLSRHPASPAGRDRAALEQPVADPGVRLGPEIGETTAGYEGTARTVLQALASSSPGSTRLALVSLRSYATPAQLQALLGGYQVRRVYLRAAVGGLAAAELPYDIHGELGSSLLRAYADVALSRLAVQRSYLAYVATSLDDKAYHDDYAAYAANAGREVSAYQHRCACLFTAIVEGPVGDLLALSKRAGIRAVQAAGKDRQLGTLFIAPLLPDTRGLVTKGPGTSAP